MGKQSTKKPDGKHTRPGAIGDAAWRLSHIRANVTEALELAPVLAEAMEQFHDDYLTQCQHDGYGEVDDQDEQYARACRAYFKLREALSSIAFSARDRSREAGVAA